MIMMMLTNFRGRDRETLDQFRLPLPSTRHSPAKVEDLRWIYSKSLILNKISHCECAKQQWVLDWLRGRELPVVFTSKTFSSTEVLC